MDHHSSTLTVHYKLKLNGHFEPENEVDLRSFADEIL